MGQGKDGQVTEENGEKVYFIGFTGINVQLNALIEVV